MSGHQQSQELPCSTPVLALKDVFIGFQALGGQAHSPLATSASRLVPLIVWHLMCVSCEHTYTRE